MNNQTHAQIDDLLHKAKSDILNLSWYVYLIIKESELPADNLQYFYETYYDSINSSEETMLDLHFSEDDSKSLKKELGKLIDAMLGTLQSRNLSEKTFYTELWTQVINCSFFTSDDQRAFALYYIWIDKRIPYYQLDEGRRMSNETYKQYINDLSHEIKKMLYILNTPSLSQKTERASLVLNILQSIENEDKRIVLMSKLISELKNDRISELSELFNRLT